jgi:hypothetical protein
MNDRVFCVRGDLQRSCLSKDEARRIAANILIYVNARTL